MFSGFENENYEPLKAVLMKEASFDRAKDRWKDRWDFYRSTFGSLKSIRAVFQLETEREGSPEVQTHLMLEFEKETRLVRALENADSRYWFDMINLPRQIAMRLVPLSENEIAGWDLRLQIGPKLKLGDGPDDSLIVSGERATQKAVRISFD